jgi:hypothetical protein
MADADRQLDPRHRIELLADSGSVGPEEVVTLWTSAGALSLEEARRRVAEVLFVAVDETDGLVGVSTVRPMAIPQLRMDLWYYRTFVARGHRAGNLAWLLMFSSRDHLAELHASGEDTRGAGLFMAVQNEGLKRTRDSAIWPASGFTFVGEDTKGAHLRVLWFPGTEAPGPP